MFEELGAKRSVMIYRVKATYPLFYINNWGAGGALMIVHSVFSVMAGLIVALFFILFSVYNTA